jgi:CelD/BcsL family acetyltransferase involved in cellulose biosynthesis
MTSCERIAGPDWENLTPKPLPLRRKSPFPRPRFFDRIEPPSISSSQLNLRRAASNFFSGAILAFSYRTIIAESVADMDCLAPLWERLLRRQDHSIFQRFSWNRLAAEVFADRITPHLVCVESDSGAAIIPAAINHASNRIELLGETLFDYRDVLHAGDPEVLQRAWQLLESLAKPFHVISVGRDAARKRWREFPAAPFAAAPRVARNLTSEIEFRRAHSRLGRQIRRLCKLGVDFHSTSGHDSDLVRRIYDCKRTQFGSGGSVNVFLDPLRCEFMVAAAAMEGEACQVYTLQKRDALVAGIVSFNDGDARRFYTTYFNPEWAHYSPGQALLYEASGRTLAQGLDCDYMTGEYSYKLRLANASHPLFRVDTSAEQLADIAEQKETTTAA